MYSKALIARVQLIRKTVFRTDNIGFKVSDKLLLRDFRINLCQ